MKDGALNDLVGIADQRAARIGAAFDRELHALRDRHCGDTLEQSLTTRGIGLRGRRSLRQRRLVDGMARPVKFTKMVLLFRSERSGLLQSSGQCGRSTDAVEIFG